jgi:hypothetical protein
MGHLALIERLRVIKIYNMLEVGCKYKYQVISRIAKSNYGIDISARGVRSLVDKWLKSKRLADQSRDNRDKILISNAGMLAINKALLKKPCLTAGKLKKDLRLVATTRTISKAINLMGWRKVQTKYCQIVRPVNRLKRFIFACLVKRFGENFDDAIVIDECTVELRIFNPTNWRKDGQPLLRASGGKLGKPKHNVKVHLFGGISRRGLLPLITFGGIMYSKDYQNWLSLSVIPFIRQKFPFGHRFYMDNDPKHTSNSTKRFILRNNINHFMTPPESPVKHCRT